MRLRAAFGFACVALGIAAVTPPAFGQAGTPAVKPLGPVERFRSARALILDGKFDLAAEELKVFLAAPPQDKDFLDLQTMYGPTVFERLRQVPVWSEDAAAQAEALKTVDEIIAKSRAAVAKVNRDPARIRKFVANLGASAEERVYAEQQLRPAGDAVVGPMVDALRGTTDLDLRAGILGAITRLGPEIIPGFMAALEGMPDDLKVGVLNAVAARPDVLSLTTTAESDPLPWLWYYASAPAAETPNLRETAGNVLRQLVGATDRRAPDAEMVALAQPFYDRTARFGSLDPAGNKVRVWAWDEAKKALAVTDMPRPQAEEFYGLRLLRWALARNPNNTTARDLFLRFAVERAEDRARLGPLSLAEPGAYQLLTATPTPLLVRLLEEAVAGQKTALVVAFTQALADRAEPAAANPTVIPLPGGKSVSRPAVLVKALDYPDPRVQLAAAVGLLRVPGPPTHGQQARVVEILRRALAAEPPAPGTTDKGRAIIGDPSDTRADRLAGYLRQLGYTPEKVTTGKDLLRRINHASDFDLIVVDRHLAGPQLPDVLPQLRNGLNAARRPVLVVASTDKPVPVPLEHLLLRLAILVAATDRDEPNVTAPFAFDPRKPTLPPEELPRVRQELRETRDQQLRTLYRSRLERLRTALETADLPADRQLRDRLDLRLPQLTYGILVAEFPISSESAPEAGRQLQVLTTLIRNRPELTRATRNVTTDTLGRIVEHLDSLLDADRRLKADTIRRRIDPNALELPADVYWDSALEGRLARLVAPYPGVTVVPEPFSIGGLGDDVAGATGDAAAQPRTPAEKKAAARTAAEWLRRIAAGDAVGYDVRPAAPALRAALADDDLADLALDALAPVPSAEVQQDFLNLALSGGRPLPLRLKAADRTILHAQAFGKLAPAAQTAAIGTGAAGEMNAELRAKFLILANLYGAKPEDLGRLLGAYAPPAPAAAPATPPAPAEPAPKN